MSRGGQKVHSSSVLHSYREWPKSLSEVPKRTDELIVYDNTAHRRGYRVAAEFIRGKLTKIAEPVADWVARLFGKELPAAKSKGPSSHATGR
jgi:predicted ABC-type ATPase